MLNYKSLLSYLLVLAMSFAITACDDCDDEEGGAEAAGEEAKADGGDEGGSEGGEECPEGGTADAGTADAGTEDGGAEDGGAEETSYNHLVLVDDGNEDGVGTSGADIYGLSVTCEGADVALTYVTKGLGSSVDGAACTTGTDCVCTVKTDDGNCGGTNRNDESNILAGSADAYYSMGNGGHVIFMAMDNLDGCNASASEKGMDESFTAFACATAEANPAASADCVEL